jgi:hypothetical protein
MAALHTSCCSGIKERPFVNKSRNEQQKKTDDIESGEHARESNDEI